MVICVCIPLKLRAREYAHEILRYMTRLAKVQKIFYSHKFFWQKVIKTCDFLTFC